MVTSLRTLVLSRAQLRKLRTLGWSVGVNASLKWAYHDASSRWELIPWENFVVSSKPVQTTLTATELLERMPRTVKRNGQTFSLRIDLLRRGAVVYYAGTGETGGILGSALPRPSLLDAAFDAFTEILKLKCV